MAGHRVCGVFRCIVGRPHAQRAGAARIDGALLDDVCQFVGEQPIASRRARPVVRGCDMDVTPHREGVRAKGACRGIDSGTGAHASLAQVRAGCALDLPQGARRRAL